MTAYVPEWAREDSPTAGLSESEAAAYWKARSVAGDCRFALRDGSTVPDELRAHWIALLAWVNETRAETPAQRTRARELRTTWRRWMDARMLSKRMGRSTRAADWHGRAQAQLDALGPPQHWRQDKPKRASVDWKARALAAESALAALTGRTETIGLSRGGKQSWLTS